MLLVGAIGIVDLRVMGAWRRVPLEPLVRALTPLAYLGFALFVASGFVMFAAEARTLVASDVFRLKLVLILAAIANALAFRRLARTRIRNWGTRAPFAARVLAATSIGLWLAVLIAGRMIAYR